MRRFFIYLAAFSFCLFSCACAPTYSKEKIIPSIVKMCQKEHGLTVIAKINDNTLGIYLPLDNLSDQNLALTQEASEKVGQVMLIIHRVLLSSSGGIEFYTITVVDKKLPSVELSLTTYIKDIKRALTLDISRSEYYQRISRDLKFNLSNNLVNADNFSVKAIKLTDFLAQQAANRLTLSFEEDKTIKVNKVSGEFKEGRFIFSLDINSNSGNMPSYLTPEKNKEILKQSLILAYSLLRRYDFKDFEEIELKNLWSREVIKIKKEDLFKAGKNKTLLDKHIS